MNLNLNIHEAVIYLLKNNPGGLTTAQLAQGIEEYDLFRKVDGTFPTATDINRRVSGQTYKDEVFLKKDGLIFYNSVIDKRLMRLTFNSERWTKPIKHKWSKAKQNTNAAFENQYGFGFEEWLLNDAFYLDGYQYGLIRGIEDICNRCTLIREIYLFTIDQITHERFLVGLLTNVEVISSYAPERKIADALVQQAMPMMKKHLREVEADLSGLSKLQHLCVRFKLEDLNLFDQMKESDYLDRPEFLRFLPYKIEGELESYLAKKLPQDRFRFKQGRAKKGGSTSRTVVGGTIDVDALHVKIIDDLALFLDSENSPYPGALEIELCKFGGNIADIVLEDKDKSYTIFEVKTSASLRRNVREALGQLLDYACWYPNLPIKQLIIVSPEKMNKQERVFFERLQQTINIKLSYWQYVTNSETFII